MTDLQVAVVDCSLPTDHPEHVTYRDYTLKEAQEAAEAKAAADAAPAVKTELELLQERITALENLVSKGETWQPPTDT
jgi:hypothetical protein